MFKGKQIKQLEELTAKLSKRLEEQAKFSKENGIKLENIEKLVNETKESLNQMSASRFDSISDELKEFNEKVGNSSATLEKVEKDLGELDQVTIQISELQSAIEEVKTESKDTQSIVTSIKDELLEERNKVVERNENLVKQEVMLNEKSGQLEKFEKELKENRALIGKLQAERDAFEKELTDAKTFRDRYYTELTQLQDEYSSFKKDSDVNFAYSGAVTKFLGSTTEGKIILEMQTRSPQTFDELAEKLNETAVRIKQSLNTLRELSAIQVNEENRTALL